MHCTIAVPADINHQALDRALGTLGLRATKTARGLLIYDHDPKRAQQPPGCSADGCTRPSLVTDAHANLCAKHWLALRVPGPTYRGDPA
jgi:hypothetical protein